MKIYKISSPGEKPTIFPLDTEEGPVEFITIGEEGRGRVRVVIPVIGEGPEVKVKKTEHGIVIVRGDWEEERRCLVVINAVGSYDRYRSYGIYEAKNLKIIAEGRRAFGDAGKVNSGPEALAIAEPGCEFRLNSKYASHWYYWDGKEWKMETPEERKARLALEEVLQGGGEWL